MFIIGHSESAQIVSSLFSFRLNLCPETDWSAPDQHCSVPVDLHQQRVKHNSSRRCRVTVEASLSPGTGIQAEEVYPALERVTQTMCDTAMISSGDFVEHQFCFAAPVFSQLDGAMGMTLLSSTAGDSHAQLQS